MGLLDAFNALNNACSFETAGETLHETPVSEGWQSTVAEDGSVFLDRYAKFTERPKFNPNYDGYISPYANAHWGASSDIMQSLAAGLDMTPVRDRVDPNRVFTSSVASLRTLAADQIKAIRLFERKFFESLNDKGKFGLNEDDIAAMQALTGARNVLTAITKEQVGIQKSVAELKIKQQQAGGGSVDAGKSAGRAASAFDVGRSIMDGIFDVSAPQQTQMNVNFPSMDSDEAATVLDEIVGDAAEVDVRLKYENQDPLTYVAIGDDDNDLEFVTYAKDGTEIPEYPTPTVESLNRSTLDRTAMTIQDGNMVPYTMIPKGSAPPPRE